MEVNASTKAYHHDNAYAQFSISLDEKDNSALTKAYPLVPLYAQSTWAKGSPFKFGIEKDRLHNSHSISRHE